MNFSGKRLLILCGNVVHVKVVEAAKSMGVYTIVTDGLPIEKAPAKKIADEALFLDVLDVDNIVKYCLENPVDGVLNFCNDIGQRPYQEICERLGLPCYGNKEQFFLLTDKVAFKRMCQEHNVDIVPQYTEADIAVGSVEFPVLVKPTDSRGSRGQAVCKNMEELLAAIPVAKQASTNGVAIIEKYMAGKQDFSISYVFIDGKAYLIRTADRYLGSEADRLNKQCMASVSPSRHTDMYLEHVNDRVANAIADIGIKDGTVFMQGFVDGNTVRFYDPGLRLGGAEYEKLLFQATGINVMQQMISFALGGKIDDYNGALDHAYLLNGKASILLFISVRGGTISTINGLDALSQCPDIVTIAQRYFPGDTVPQTGDVRQRVFEIAILTELDRKKELVDWVYSQIQILDANGNDLIVSRVDSSLI